MFLHHLHDVFLFVALFSKIHIVSKRLSAMARTITRGANQLALRRHMLTLGDKPIDGENSLFCFLCFAHAHDSTESMMRSCRVGIFDSLIDSRQLRRRSQASVSSQT
jgi:hypothetical protein